MLKTLNKKAKKELINFKKIYDLLPAALPGPVADPVMHT